MVISENGMGLLWIRNVTVFDEGEYSCVASNNLQSIIYDQISVLDVFDRKYYYIIVCIRVNMIFNL